MRKGFALRDRSELHSVLGTELEGRLALTETGTEDSVAESTKNIE
jgi:hypothetical protein